MSNLEQSPPGIYDTPEILLLNGMAKDFFEAKSISVRMHELWLGSVFPAFWDAGFEPDASPSRNDVRRDTFTFSRNIVDPVTQNVIRVEQAFEIPVMVEFRWVLRLRVLCGQSTMLASAAVSSIPSDGPYQQTIVQWEDNSCLSPSADFAALVHTVVASLSQALSA